MRDIERVTIMKEMTHSMAAPLVDISVFDKKKKALRKRSRRRMASETYDAERCGLGPDLHIPEELRRLNYESCDSMEISNENWFEKGLTMTANVLHWFNLMKWIHQSWLYHETTEFLHDVDHYSRRLFPTFFLLLNIAYWSLYLYIL